MPDPHIRRTADDYAEIFAGDLPSGPAWPRDVDSILMLVVDGLMENWGRVDSRFDDLLSVESDPRYTFEMLPDWESALGLPDPCLTAPQTIPDRRTAVLTRLTTRGGQSRAFFIAEAASLGYTISIYEFQPVICGITRCGDTRMGGTLTITNARCGVSQCGIDRLGQAVLSGTGDWIWQLGAPELRYFWKVRLLNTRVTWFRCGTGIAGQDHLADIAYALDLECMIRRYSPAHSTVIFDYGSLDTPSDGTLDWSVAGNADQTLVR